jgi:type I restriction-modification system DNA methylase subunit
VARSTVHYADNKTNNALKALHNKLRPAGTPVQRVEYIIELLLLRIFEAKVKQDEEFKPLRNLFASDYKWKNPKTGKEESNENRLFSYLTTVSNEQILLELNDNFFPFYSTILQSARRVFTGNLPQKVQDQLVLIEEVFSNSNFSNNVNSGNLGEVISIIANDIEEARLLKTDLLGDAIESALSETGGTKDIGLFRTPDHVRQFMTAIIEPSFDDLIFDPACGSGNFLLYAFDFFYALYIDQIENYGADYEERDIPKLIIENNLHGIDLDDRAVQLAQLGLFIKAKKKQKSIGKLAFKIVSSDFFLPEYENVKQIFEKGNKLTHTQREVIENIWSDLHFAHKFGSLIRLNEKIESELKKEKPKTAKISQYQAFYAILKPPTDKILFINRW